MQIPKLKIVEDAVDAMWELLRLRATSFSPEELQQEDPISSKSASLGEEISSADVVRARWTPSGIAKHGRCALLVLTQNLLLSLWSPEKQPRLHQDWQRRFIINHELQKYFEAIFPDLKQESGERRSERLKELIRVRAFAVSRPFDAGLRRVYSVSLDGLCLIATANDNNEVFILRCCGSEDEKGVTELAVETHFSVRDDDDLRPGLNWTFEDYIEKPRFVQHLAWSPWIVDSDGRLRSMLLCATRNALLFRWIIFDFSEGELNIMIEDFEGVVKLKKPWSSDTIVEWLPDLHSGRFGRVVACTLDKVFMFTIDLLDEQAIESVKFERNHYAQAGGQLYFTNEESTSLVQTLPHMSKSREYLTSLELPGLKATDGHRHGLQEAIQSNRKIFDEKFKTRGNVLTKIWGLADSPLHDLAMTCVTFHPSNSPEYIIPADMSARVIFQPTAREDFISQAILQGASTEAVAFSAKWIVKNLKSQPERKTLVWRLLEQMENAMSSITIPEPNPQSSDIRDLLFSSADLVRMRYDYVLSVLMGHSDSAENCEKLIIEKLAQKVLYVPQERWRDSHISQAIITNFHRLLVMLNLSGEDTSAFEAETCDLCSSDIAFDSYTSAHCGRGHQFGECQSSRVCSLNHANPSCRALRSHFSRDSSTRIVQLLRHMREAIPEILKRRDAKSNPRRHKRYRDGPHDHRQEAALRAASRRMQQVRLLRRQVRWLTLCHLFMAAFLRSRIWH